MALQYSSKTRSGGQVPITSGVPDAATRRDLERLYQDAVLLDSRLTTAEGTLDTRPRGWVAEGRKTSSQSGISAITFITGINPTFTPVAGRKYRFTLTCDIAGTTVGDVFVLKLITAPSSTQRARITGRCNGTASETFTLTWTNDATFVDTQATPTLERATGAGTFSVESNTTHPAILTIEDLGAL
jgi:hypothetical protein